MSGLFSGVNRDTIEAFDNPIPFIPRLSPQIRPFGLPGVGPARLECTDIAQASLFDLDLSARELAQCLSSVFMQCQSDSDGNGKGDACEFSN